MIDSQPTKLWPYMQRGYVYFLMQDLHSANESFKINHVNAPVSYKLTQRYLSKAQPGEILDVDTLSSLLEDLNIQRSKAILLIMMLYDRYKRESLLEHSRIVKIVLHKFNRHWEDRLFIFDAKESSLQLSGKGLSYFSTRRNTRDSNEESIALLQTLSLKNLDLRGSDIHKLSELKGLHIEVLDIRKTLINDCSEIHSILPKLKRLIVTKSQVKSHITQVKNKRLKIIVK